MYKRLALLILVIIIAGGLLWWFFGVEIAPSSPAASTQTPIATSSVPQQIPGNNLTLGEDKDSSAGWYLIGYNAMALYEYTGDATGTSNCAGACAVEWPPYIVSTTTNLVAEYPVSGKLGTITRADGSLQATYNGMPLYFYSGDKLSGEAKGYNVSPQWHVAKP